MKSRTNVVALCFLIAIGTAILLSCGGQGPKGVGQAPTSPVVAEPGQREADRAAAVEIIPKQIEERAQAGLSRIKQQVAEDTVKQYEIAKRNGSAIDAYVHAGLVAAAYLQAHDESNYQKWKEIEASEAVTAGIPSHETMTRRIRELDRKKEGPVVEPDAGASRKLRAGILDGAARMEADAKARARLKFEKEHPDEAAQQKFGGVLRNARALIKAQIYTGAEKMLRRIIAEAPGTKVAAEAKQVLESMPKTP
jgi:hypothetical protein